MTSGIASSFETAFEQVSGLIREFKYQHQELTRGRPPTQLVGDFVAAIDWSERWIHAILFTHLLLLVILILYRKNSAVQIAVFLLACIIVFLAQPLNSLGAEFWEYFARQPYFDKRGAFFSGVVSLPLVLIMMLVVVNLVIDTVGAMWHLKRMELQRQSKQGVSVGKDNLAHEKAE
jgi:transmembrane protein 18